MDALDECPNTTGTPSARDEVLDFVEDLVMSDLSNLFLCITSRPEQDMQTVLNPLTSASCRVALHDECGQKEDIYNHIRSFVSADRAMRRWREEDKELVINTLSGRRHVRCPWYSALLFIAHSLGQVSVGVLPTGQPASMLSTKHSQDSERIANDA